MPPQYRNADTLTGLDVLEAEGFKPLQGRKVGLITNHTGVDRNGRRNIDLITAAGVRITALFSPEHGFLGSEDRAGIKDAVDPTTGITVFSLYGETVRPTSAMLKDVDTLVFDIADVGVRFYTYETTMAYALESADKAGIEFWVLDRPNPVTGTRVEGPMLDPDQTSFTGYLAGEPVRHGMTMGELAQLFNAANHLKAKLHVVKMRDWQRADWFDSTGQPWVNPSPNMRSLKAAILYPGVCLIEFASNLSIGRGTDSPFEQFGADFIHARSLAKYLNARRLPGLRFYPTSFTPTESRFSGKRIEGVRIEITNREQVRSAPLGIELACAIQKLYPGNVDWQRGRKLIGSRKVIEMIIAGKTPEEIERSYAEAEGAFRKMRQPYLLY